jgi:transposase
MKKRVRAILKECEDCGTTGKWFCREIKCDICGGRLNIISKERLHKKI